jgi:hypothetical protein
MFEDILDGWNELEEAIAEEPIEDDEDWDTGNRWDTGRDSDVWSTTDSVDTWQS